MPDHPSSDKFGFGQAQKAFEVVKRRLPILLADQARNYFLKAFQDQAWDGKAWKDVQRRDPSTNAYKYPLKKDLSRRTRPIELGKTGNERRAVSNSIAIQTWPTVRLVVDMRTYGADANYAQFQNQGTTNMVARPFMGHTEALGKMQKDLINEEVDKAFKP